MEFLALKCRHHWILLIIGLHVLVPVWAITKNCSHYYLSQPISTLTCNPYHDLNPVLMLECNTYGQGNGKSYKILWFHSESIGTTDNTTLLGQNNLNKVRISTTGYEGGFVKSQLIITTLNPADSGAYWCRIGVRTGADSTTIILLQPSQRTHLLPEEEYIGLPPCAKEAQQVEAVSRCASEVPPSQPRPTDITEVPTAGTISRNNKSPTKQTSTTQTPSTQIPSSTTQTPSTQIPSSTTQTPSTQIPSSTTPATDPTNFSIPAGSEVTLNSTSGQSNNSCAEEGGSILPSWSYGVIAAGATAVIANVVILLVILVACRVSKRTRKDSSDSTGGKVESQLQTFRPPPVTNHRTEPVSIPLVPNGPHTSEHRETLPMHLSVARIASNSSDYVYSEIGAPQENPQSPESTPQFTSNQSSSSNGVQRHLGVSLSPPVLSSSTPEVRIAETAENGKHSAAAEDIRNNRKTVTKEKPKKPLPLPKPHLLCAMRRHRSTENEAEDTESTNGTKKNPPYHAINTQALDVSSVYTTPDQVTPEPNMLTGNDSRNVNQTYQPLTPMTADYMSLYCTTS